MGSNDAIMKLPQSLLCAALAIAGLGASAMPSAAPAAEYAPLSAVYDAGSASLSSPPGDQNEARREMRAGKAKSLREIEQMILPKMKGAEYLGPSYDSVAHAYRLKFIRKGRVMYIDVDARTGRIINRSN